MKHNIKSMTALEDINDAVSELIGDYNILAKNLESKLTPEQYTDIEPYVLGFATILVREFKPKVKNIIKNNTDESKEVTNKNLMNKLNKLSKQLDAAEDEICNTVITWSP